MRFGWIAALAALLAPASAAADVTARYRQASGEPDMSIQVNDRGDSRMTVTQAAYVTKDGITYMVMSDAQGIFAVRQEDFLALMAEVLAATDPADPPANASPITITEAGAETVAGRAGRLFRIAPSANPSDMFEVVIGEDADLAPVTAVAVRHLAPFFDTMNRSTPGLAEAIREVLGRGALLRFGPIFQLDSVDAAPVPASAFELPSAPIGREALAERLGLGAQP
jgi:hypothetical protein